MAAFAASLPFLASNAFVYAVGLLEITAAVLLFAGLWVRYVGLGVLVLLAAISMMAIVYGLVAFRPWWKRAIMIASAIPFAVLGNLVRMLTIIVASEIGGQQHRQEWGNKVHESTILGIIPYIPAILGLFLLGHLLEGKRRKSSTPEAEKQQPENQGQRQETVPMAKEAQV